MISNYLKHGFLKEYDYFEATIVKNLGNLEDSIWELMIHNRDDFYSNEELSKKLNYLLEEKYTFLTGYFNGLLFMLKNDNSSFITEFTKKINLSPEQLEIIRNILSDEINHIYDYHISWIHPEPRVLVCGYDFRIDVERIRDFLLKMIDSDNKTF